MLSEETRRKLREMQMDALVEALDEQEKNIAAYIPKTRINDV